MSAGDQVIDSETLLFFEKQPAALPIYECFAERLYERFPDTKRRVQKTQIHSLTVTSLPAYHSKG